jgi:hypothetical protein
MMVIEFEEPERKQKPIDRILSLFWQTILLQKLKIIDLFRKT